MFLTGKRTSNVQISGPRNIFSNPISLDDLMDDDSNSGGEMVNMNDVFEISGSPMSASSSPPRSPENMTRPSIIVPVKSKNPKYFGSKILKYFSH